MKQWKRILSFVLAVSLVASMGIVLPEVQADSSPVFPTETTWDFAGADGWTLGNGYAVSDGKLVWQTVGAQNSGTSAYLGNTDAAAWTNYTLSADITATYNNSANQNQHAMAGLNFYVSDSDNIQIRVRPTTVANKFTLYVRENGAALDSKDVLVGTDTSVNKETRSFNLKADMHYDGKLTVYINDTEVWTGTVSTPGGKPGVTAWASAGSATTADTVTFDNVKVTPLAAPVVTPTPDFSGTLLGWSDGSEALGTDWTVSGTATAENGVLKATTADNFSAKVGSAVQHGYIEADVTLPAKSDFTATVNKALGYLTATVGSNQVYTLRLFWQQTKNSTTLHDGTLYADLFINDSAANMTAQYGGAAQGTRVSFKLADANWGKTYTMRLARIGNFVNASLVDTETGSTLKSWQYALNPAYSIVTGPVTFAFAADTKDTGCTVTFDNVVAASVDAYAVSAGELEMTVDSLKEIAAGRDDSTIDSFYRTAYAPGEIVTVTLKSADAWKLDSLGYTTASNPTGAKLVATDDDKVYTFIMPDEAVTLVGESAAGEITEPAYELLYDMAATPDANSTTGWRANATTVADKGVCVKPAADTNGLTNYYNTGVVSGWIKADITLPTITEAQLQTNAANTGDIWYGLRMCRGDGANIESSKYIDAAIWYQRHTGTSETAPKTGKTYLRIRFANTGYTTANLLEVNLPNTLWTTGATVHMEMRKVGNYIFVKLTCDTIPEANQIACCTVNFDTFAGGKDGTWKFGLTADNPLLYTDWTKTEQVAAEAYFNNVEIGKILRTVSVSVDSAAAEYVSLPEVNEFKGAALARDAYEVGEVLKLTVADGADAANLKYTTEDNTDGVAITDASAFEVPNEDAITIIYNAETGGGSTEPEDLISATYNGGEYDATKWTATGSNAYVSEPFANGYIEAEFAISGEIKNAANMFVRSPKTAGGALFGQEEEIMLRWTVTADDSQPGYTHKATSALVIRDYATPGYHLASSNAIHGKAKTVYLNIQEGTPATLKVKMEVVGNLLRIYVNGELHIEATFDPQYNIASQAGFFGFYGLSDNAKVTKATVQEYKTYTVTTPDSMIADETAHLVNPTTMGASFGRTQYVAGEIVTIMVNNTTGLDLTTLRYTTATNTEGTALTETAIPGIYTFEMPNEAATVVCDAIALTPPSEVIATVDGASNLDADLWTVTGAYTADGTIRTTANNFSAKLDGTYQHFTMEADITVPAKPADLSANITFASLKATVGSGQSYTARFFWQGGSNQKLYFDLFLDDSVNGTTSGEGKHNYGGAGQGTRISTVLSDSHWSNTYTVKLTRIGNYLYVQAVDKATSAVVGEKVFNLNPAYSVTTGAVTLSFNADGSKGEVAFDNVKVTSYNARTVDKGELNVSLDPIKEIAPGLETGATIETFERTHYAAGETVTVIVNDDSGLDLTTLRYTTASNPTGTVLVAGATPGTYTFVMPNENVTLLCDEGQGGSITPPPAKPEGVVVLEDFDRFSDGTSSADALADLDIMLGEANAQVKDSALAIAGGFSAQTPDKYLHGYIEADICLVSPQATLENGAATKYGGNMSARWAGYNGSLKELRTRFMVKHTPDAVEEYTVQLQLIVYCNDDYGTLPTTLPYTINNFQWGDTYRVRLTVIGNMVQVQLNGAVVLTYAMAADGTLANYEGRFGFAHTADSFAITVDNLKAEELKVYKVSFSSAMEDVLKTDSYADVVSGKQVARTHFLADEFVKLHVGAPSGYGIDDATIKYTGQTCGDVAITAKDSAVLYGFKMPAEDVAVSASLTAVVAETNPINETFDYESLMVDRGWGKDFMILDGKVRAFGNGDAYLSGVAGSNNWKNYTASAKITMLSTTSSKTGVAALCVRTDNTSTGYEYGVTFGAGSQTGYLRLYDRTNGNMLYTGEAELELGKEYTLTMVVDGSTITGYLNGAWRFSVDVGESLGAVGFRSQNANTIFEDIKVTDIVAG